MLSSETEKHDFTRVEVLSYLSDQELAMLREQCTACVFSAGNVIVERNEQDHTVYFIMYGRVHVLNYSSAGRIVTYSSIAEGGMFGEMAAIDGLPRSAWVCAVNDCMVIKISKEIFLSYLQNNPTFSMAVMRKLSKNLRELDERLVNILSMRAEQRVCVEIISMARPTSVESGFYCVVEMPTHSNFANLVGLSRETVSRILSRLRRDGLVKTSGNVLDILDRKGLENRAFDQSF
ncbi:Crp/Fnr family transcriptional regulator [Alphaproteobacteria bacterium]|nr:Crp/Fnr family transcriptional regulator [Alphaproteobacteria bacterium]